MNKCYLIGRLVKDPEVRYSTGANPTAVARYTLAVDRKYKRDGEATADFIRCIAFGKGGEFAEKYLHKGMKIAVNGRVQTGSYKGNDGSTIFTTDIVVEEHEFVESRNMQQAEPTARKTAEDGFMNVIEEGELPFD